MHYQISNAQYDDTHTSGQWKSMWWKHLIIMTREERKEGERERKEGERERRGRERGGWEREEGEKERRVRERGRRQGERCSYFCVWHKAFLHPQKRWAMCEVCVCVSACVYRCVYKCVYVCRYVRVSEGAFLPNSHLDMHNHISSPATRQNLDPHTHNLRIVCMLFTPNP